jgi:hypothetical protein
VGSKDYRCFLKSIKSATCLPISIKNSLVMLVIRCGSL